MKKTYSEKEICVFNGVLSLCKEGKKIYNITVQEIAKAADMGKGTLYEYFSSKEDIILNALLYFLWQDNLKSEEIAQSGVCFKQKVYGLYDLVAASFENGFALLSQFAVSEEILNFPKLISSHSEYVTELVDFRKDVIVRILKSGVAEGVISLDLTRNTSQWQSGQI
ncbi:MAG: TetR/AcrR family transcriptional regulator [Oscillospiraceae bacterium]|nr:TetR/AcrR family transcriptional regulator [Oscillospiraceae bacterium]